MQRFFVEPEAIQADEVVFPPDLAQQIGRVLRLRPGDRVVVLDNSGTEREVELVEIGKRRTRGRVRDSRNAGGEPRVVLTLFPALLKGKKLELVLQKCTELGVARFAPVLAERSIVERLDDLREGKLDRWRAIIREAAEQSRRGLLPGLLPPMKLKDALAHAHSSGGLTLIPWEEERTRALKDVLVTGGSRLQPNAVNLFIGPEGGFTAEEVEVALAYGAVPVTLGPRILRAETAAVAATAAILYELGEWR